MIEDDFADRSLLLRSILYLKQIIVRKLHLRNQCNLLINDFVFLSSFNHLNLFISGL